MAQQYAQGAYNQGHYAYPPSYSYYPTRNYPYQQNRSKLIYPAILIIAGLLLAGFSFMHLEKLDPKIASIAAADPNKEIAAVVFCEHPCGAVEATVGDAGRQVATGKYMVVDSAGEIRDLADVAGVKQVQLLGKFSSS